LVFPRSGDDGKLALALGDGAPATLPLAISVGVDGRSAEPIHVTLSIQGSVVTVGALGQTLQFGSDPATMASQNVMDVVVSAGAMEDWPLEAMTVTVATPDEISASDEGHSNSPTAGSSPDAQDAITRPTGSGTNVLLIAGGDGSVPVTRSNKGGAPSGNSTLEIFTPPAVRHGRADAIRAALVSNK
jgi:hypothetical protein